MSWQSGLRKAAMPYIGNIHREVFPMSFSSRFRYEPKEVNRISRHHPVNPQSKKFFPMKFSMSISLAYMMISAIKFKKK